MTKAERLFRLANEYDAAFGNGDRTGMGESLRREAYDMLALEQLVSKDEKDAREAVVSFADEQSRRKEWSRRQEWTYDDFLRAAAEEEG